MVTTAKLLVLSKLSDKILTFVYCALAITSLFVFSFM